jgi:hypothetical protein
MLTAFLELERITHELAVSAVLGDDRFGALARDEFQPASLGTGGGDLRVFHLIAKKAGDCRT